MHCQCLSGCGTTEADVEWLYYVCKVYTLPSARYVPSVGNHEEMTGPWVENFLPYRQLLLGAPEDQPAPAAPPMYYSLNVHDVHIAVIDTESVIFEGSPQWVTPTSIRDPPNSLLDRKVFRPTQGRASAVSE